MASDDEVKRLNKKRATLLVVATTSFQTAMSPPAGLWSDDYGISFTGHTRGRISLKEPTAHIAGTSIMARNDPDAFRNFTILNSMAFYLSLAVIVTLVTGFTNQYIMMLVVMALEISCVIMAINFGIVLVAITPPRAIRANFSPRQPKGYIPTILFVIIAVFIILVNVVSTCYNAMKQKLYASVRAFLGLYAQN